MLRPDTYVGSVELQTQHLWVWDTAADMMVYREVKYVPGLYKIFDEVLVNAADNYQRDKTMNCIKVDVDAARGEIKIWNNGLGIPVEMHKDAGCYVPEMIFGQLLTSSNYDDEQKKVTGGRNGFGAKLANIFSTKFIIETADAKRGKKYRQVFRNSMQDKEAPEITANPRSEDYTCVTFQPDLSKFKMTHMDEDIVSLLTKRAYDLAGISKVKVMLNGRRIEVKDFQSYCDLYLKNAENSDLPKITEVKHPRWEIAASLSDG